MSNQIQQSTYSSEVQFIDLAQKKKKANLSALGTIKSALEEAVKLTNQRESDPSTLSFDMIQDLMEGLLEQNEGKVSDALAKMQTPDANTMTTTATQTASSASVEETSDTDSTSSTISYGGMDAVFEMEALLTLLQETYIESAASSSEDMVKMGNSIIDVLDKQYDKITDQLEKERKWDHMSFWDKLKCGFKLVFDTISLASPLTLSNPDALKSDLKDIENNPVLGDALKGLGYIAMGATVLIACATGNFELLALTVVLFALTQSGAMNDMTNEVAKGLEEAGLSDSVAKVLADVIVVVALVLAGGTAGGISMAADDATMTATDLVGEEGIEMVDMAAETAGETAASSTEETAQQVTFNLKRAIGIGLNIGGQTLASKNFAMDLTNALPISKKDKMKWMIALEVLITIACIAASLGGGSMAASAEGESAISAQLKSVMGKLSGYTSEAFPETFQKFSMNADKMMQIGRTAGTIASGLSGFYGIMQGKAMIDRGKIQKKMKEWEGNIAILSSALTQNQDMIQSGQKQEESTLKSFSDMTQTYSDFAAPQLAVANAMLQG